jgi:hypothetical protein
MAKPLTRIPLSCGTYVPFPFLGLSMTCLLSRSTLALAITLFVTAPFALHVGAQNPTPSAAVSLMRIPQLARNAFPGDFNRDNRTDLIAGGQTTSGASSLMLAVGAGDGTFAAPRALGIAAEPAAVSDINADGRQDVVVGTSSGISVLPGTGDGTFGTLRPVATGGGFLAVADFNGDGHRDVVLGGTDAAGNPGLAIYPGHGDFTFGPQMFVPMSVSPNSAIAGDFNGDGRLDLVTNNVEFDLLLYLGKRPRER